ncbi:hypothetical protein GQ42DRAFT_23388 [Ramicandelaber brevisporus]|nr:hypothetical protein GQ42DRAFT_23388 [Ramicandelaber brevisporus]
MSVGSEHVIRNQIDKTQLHKHTTFTSRMRSVGNHKRKKINHINLFDYAHGYLSFLLALPFQSMSTRPKGKSFPSILYSMTTDWLSKDIHFSIGGRFILIPDVDKLHSALVEAATTTATADSDNGGDDSQQVVYGNGGGPCMSSYSSLRRQMSAYNFSAVEPQTMPLFEIPSGVLLSAKSRIWFHPHFYRGAVSWKKVPRVVPARNKKNNNRSNNNTFTRRSLTPPSSPLTSDSDSPTLGCSYRVVVRKTAIKYRDAIKEIERHKVGIVLPNRNRKMSLNFILNTPIKLTPYNPR